MLAFLAALLLQGPDLPPPRGLVNDFASVVPAASAARMERIAADVRAKSGGEIAIVTLGDLGGREPSDIALRIGREWRVGPMGEAGDAQRNLGAVILVVPKETAANGRGRCFVATARGAEGFLTDGEVASFCREALPYFAQRDYGRGMELLTVRVAQEFAREGGFALDTSATAAAPSVSRGPVQPARRVRSINPLLMMFIIFAVVSMLNRARGGGRRRRGGLPGVIFIPPIGGGWGGGWGSGGSFGGGGGGGFGGFGGGGGFSGGGGGSDW